MKTVQTLLAPFVFFLFFATQVGAQSTASCEPAQCKPAQCEELVKQGVCTPEQAKACATKSAAKCSGATSALASFFRVPLSAPAPAKSCQPAACQPQEKTSQSQTVAVTPLHSNKNYLVQAKPKVKVDGPR